jgi:hypothetical protein
MYNFKIGDKVRIRKESAHYFSNECHSRIGIIVEINAFDYIIDFKIEYQYCPIFKANEQLERCEKIIKEFPIVKFMKETSISKQ